MASADFASMNVHGTAISVGGVAVLLRGASGTGKSDLALRTLVLPPGPLVRAQPMLVADDRVDIGRDGDRIMLACPAPLRGKLEVRGIGVVPVPFTPSAVLALVADLVALEAVERFPESIEPATILGIAIPRLQIAPFEPSAPIKLLIKLELTRNGNAGSEA